jgi:hypothetical protein
MVDRQLASPAQYASPTQVAAALYQAGFRGSSLIQMTAISIQCENPAGNVGIVNDSPATGDYSVGLFQINYFANLNSSRTKQYGSPASLASNISEQANAAWSISSQGTNWSPWGNDFGNVCDYRNGLPGATVAATAATAMSDAQRAATLAKLGDSAAGGAGAAASSDPKAKSDCVVSLPTVDLKVTSIGGGCLFYASWGRALLGGVYVAAGGALMLIGLVAAISQTKVGKAARTAIKGSKQAATPQGPGKTEVVDAARMADASDVGVPLNSNPRQPRVYVRGEKADVVPPKVSKVKPPTVDIPFDIDEFLDLETVLAANRAKKDQKASSYGSAMRANAAKKNTSNYPKIKDQVQTAKARIVDPITDAEKKLWGIS